MNHLPLLVGVLAMLAVACSGAAQGSVGGGYVAGDGSAASIPRADREPAPPVEATTLDGERVAMTDLEGPVVVNFWASWCGPCVQEAPALANVARSYEGRVRFMGVNVKDQTAAARNFERDFKVPFPSWEDRAATIAASFGGIGPGALPSTIVLDAEHRVAARMFGAVTEPQLAEQLELVLGEAGR